MSNHINLFTPIKIGPYNLSNRIVMALLTRNRARTGNVPGPMNVTYYAQRASAGLIITESTQVSPQGLGYPNTPGIHNAQQVGGGKCRSRARRQNLSPTLARRKNLTSKHA